MTVRNNNGGISRNAWSTALFICLLLPSTVFAADLRIGYVNLARVLEEAPQGVAAQKKLESEFRPRDRELVELQNRIQQIESDLQKIPPAKQSTETRNRERELLTLKRELKRSTQEFREDHNQRRNEELSLLQQVVQKAIADLAKQEKYDLILHEGTLYASDTIDITEKVLRRLGKQ